MAMKNTLTDTEFSIFVSLLSKLLGRELVPLMTDEEITASIGQVPPPTGGGKGRGGDPAPQARGSLPTGQ